MKKECNKQPARLDELPDWAEVDIRGIRKIVGNKSRATIYRWMEKGILPPPVARAGTHNMWKVGDIRRALACEARG